MVTPTGLVGLLVVLGLCWVVFHLVTQAGTPAALDRRERAELEDLRALVDDLKETAWDHRELDSPLSTIVIDKIRMAPTRT
jgi:hypothetical protein